MTPENIFLISWFLFFFAILSWRKTLWGVALVAGLLPLYVWRFSIFGIPVTVLELMILILFGVWAIRKKFSIFPPKADPSQTDNFQFSKWPWLCLAWIFVSAIAIFIAPDTRAAAGIWKAYFLEPLLFLAVFLSTVKSKRDLEFIFSALAGTAIVLGILAIYQKFTGYLIPTMDWFLPETRRITGWYWYPNAVGLFLAPLIPIFFGLFFENARRIFFYPPAFGSDAQARRDKGGEGGLAPSIPLRRGEGFLAAPYFLLACILSLLAIIFAVSEGALVGVVAGFFLFFLFFRRGRWMAIATAAIFAVFLWSQPATLDFVKEKVFLRDVSGVIRRDMWAETFEMLKTRPIFGTGLSGYQTAVAPFHKKSYVEIYMYPHNVFLNMWSELGLAGLAIFLLIIGKACVEGFTVWKRERGIWPAMLLVGLVVLLVHGLVDAPYFKNDLAVLFWILIGSLILLRKFDIVERQQSSFSSPKLGEE